MPTERVHIPTELGDDEVRAVVLLLLQEGDVGFEAAALDMALGRACDRDGELVAELLADELDKLGCVVQIAVRAGPAEGQVAAQGEHMVDAVVKVSLQLFPDVFLGVADAGEVGHRGALAVGLDLLQDLKVLADIGAACAVGAGDVVRVQGVQLFQHTALAAQLFHADVGLGGEYLKRECIALLHDFSYAHGFCLLKYVYFTQVIQRDAAHSDTTLSYHISPSNSRSIHRKGCKKCVDFRFPFPTIRTAIRILPRRQGKKRKGRCLHTERPARKGHTAFLRRQSRQGLRRRPFPTGADGILS